MYGLPALDSVDPVRLIEFSSIEGFREGAASRNCPPHGFWTAASARFRFKSVNLSLFISWYGQTERQYEPRGGSVLKPYTIVTLCLANEFSCEMLSEVQMGIRQEYVLGKSKHF